MPELSDLYSEKILHLAANPPAAPRLTTPDASARKVSRICGSTIEVDVIVREGVIIAYGHTVRACALGQTSAAIVSREIVGTPVTEFQGIADSFRAMLLADGAPPDGRWHDLRYLEPVREFPNRHASTLLVFDAVLAALDQLKQNAA